MGLSSPRLSRALRSSARSLAVALSLATAVVTASAGCSDDDDDGGAAGSGGGATTRAVTIPFVARVADKAFACGQTYENLGTSKTTAKPLDFRLYVHDVRLVRAGGEEVPVTLDQDGTWQNGGVALLDFEDGTADCTDGDAALNTSIKGTVPDHDDYQGIAFRFGLPADRNHLDSATATAPLNIPAMWWSWQSGYKYLKLDLSTRRFKD
ncbi:MAG: metallo-mystery pair system four-Cys motif protein, partial [Myxococcales bacterium]